MFIFYTPSDYCTREQWSLVLMLGGKGKANLSHRGTSLRFPSMIGQNQILIERCFSRSVDRGNDSGEYVLHVWALCPIGKILDLVCVVERHFFFIADGNRPFGSDNCVQRLLPKADVASTFLLANQTGHFLLLVKLFAVVGQFVPKYLGFHRTGA